MWHDEILSDSFWYIVWIYTICVLSLLYSSRINPLRSSIGAVWCFPLLFYVYYNYYYQLLLQWNQYSWCTHPRLKAWTKSSELCRNPRDVRKYRKIIIKLRSKLMEAEVKLQNKKREVFNILKKQQTRLQSKSKEPFKAPIWKPENVHRVRLRMSSFIWITVRTTAASCLQQGSKRQTGWWGESASDLAQERELLYTSGGRVETDSAWNMILSRPVDIWNLCLKALEIT